MSETVQEFLENQPKENCPIQPDQFTPAPVDDPLSPDAPIHHYLSISSNPCVATASDEELIKLVQRMKTLATSPQTLSAKLNLESKGRKSKPLTAEQIRRKELIDSI